ncbi:MAG: VanZ family protein [Clostridiales bacterium]|nr:VanZ family protein [Clostridiales bacterium]
MLTVTVLPEVSMQRGLNLYYPGGSFGAHNATSWNLVPGNFLNYVGNSLQYYGGAALYVSLLGNVCLFVPLGLLAVLCYGGAWWKYLAAGAAFSICIEMFQLLLPRATDIDDVLCNTAGMLLGYLLGRLCLRLSGRKKPAPQKPAEQENSKRVYLK